MADVIPKAVLEAADVSDVTQLVLRERLSRDLGWWEQMHRCFHADSIVRLSWINASGSEFVRRSKELAARGIQAMHRLGPMYVTLAGDRAIAQLAAVIEAPFVIGGVEAMLSSHTRLLFRARRDGQEWRLSGLDAIYQRDEMAASVPGQLISIDMDAIKSFRKSYRLLAYCMATIGIPARDDLPGVDRPDLVRALTEEIYGWAQLPAPS